MRCHTFLLVIAAACSGDAAGERLLRHSVPRPEGGERVACSESLQARVDAAAPGSVLLLDPGLHQGPVLVKKPLTLWGPPEAILRSGGSGSTVEVVADQVSLLGFTIDGSGQRFDLLDGGVRVKGADLRIEGIEVRGALFGILVEACKRVQVVGNRVLGSGDPSIGLRGDGIRLWETSDSLVEGNEVRDSRDMVVWYSSRNRVVDNEVRDSRYGTHFMYSHNNEVVGNRYIDDTVGIFVMYSHDLVLRRNLMARAGGAAGMGLGMKESGNLTVEENWLVADAVGLYLDTAPLDPAQHNHFARNVISLCETAVSFHASTPRNEFLDNEFAGCGAVVKVGGEGDAMGCRFDGNHFDSYRGYDLDHDGRGDVPFAFRRLSTQLEGRYPELALLHGAPAMEMVDLVGEVMPLFTPRQLMLDLLPRMQAPTPAWRPEASHAR